MPFVAPKKSPKKIYRPFSFFLSLDNFVKKNETERNETRVGVKIRVEKKLEEDAMHGGIRDTAVNLSGSFFFP